MKPDGGLVGSGSAGLRLAGRRRRLRSAGARVVRGGDSAIEALPTALGLGATTTGAAIRLTIAPDGVRAYSPAETVLSITVPGLSCQLDPDDQSTGPSSDACSQMDFFSSRAAAEEWVQNHPDVAILTVEEAFELAQRNWIARRQS